MSDSDLLQELHRELEWEEDMVNRGVQRFIDAQEEARRNGRGDEASASRVLLKHYLQEVANGIAEYREVPPKGRDSTDRQLLRQLDAEVIALITLKVILGDLHNPNKTLPSAAHDIGHRIEDEILMMKFHSEHSTYFEEIMRRLDDKESYSRRYKLNSIKGSMRLRKGVEYEAWSLEQKYRIGQRLIQIAESRCDLFKIVQSEGKFRGKSVIAPTDECLEWIKGHDDAMSLMFPDRMPMLVPPEPWSTASDGGYYLPQLRKMTPMIIRSPLAVAKSTKWLDLYVDMPEVYTAINTVQNTPWQINERVLSVLYEVSQKNLGVGMPQAEPYLMPKCPLAEGVSPKSLQEGSKELDEFNNWKYSMRLLHEMEAERKAKLVGVLRTIRMAGAMRGIDKFYFVYRLDFRGRMYCATNGLSPQGTELSKALLHFHKGKPLGERGWFWFRIAGANRFGKDKVSFEDRVQWVMDNKDKWLAVAGDPIGNREIWAEADEPYQFLAWCFEFADALMVGPETFRSRIPIGMDGSCNGLQHFSAMLRDSVGGSAVNLVPRDLPADIYQRVADVLTEKLRVAAPTEQAAANWLSALNLKGYDRVPRSLSKKPVMTLPYGSTQQACTHSIFSWIHENLKGTFPQATEFKHALYLSPLLWASIGEVVIAARQAMSWIRKCTSIAVKHGKHLMYRSPLNFPVKQRTEKRDVIFIKTYLDGNLRTSVTVPNGALDSIKMQNGSSPNFVHNADSTHLTMTINAMYDEGVRYFAFIHDDFGTHAADVELMHRVIREQFVKMYTENDVLQSFKDQMEAFAGCDLPDLPAKGTLDITQVLNSRYFFS